MNNQEREKLYQRFWGYPPWLPDYHMLTGKAVQRAFRGLLLVDSALRTMIVSDEFKVKAPCLAPAQDITEMEAESSTALPD